VPETRTATLKAAVIGYGVGAKHAAAYHAMDGAELVAVCDFDVGKRAIAAAAFPSIKVVSDAAEILSDPSIDLVSIASHDDAHHAQAVAALSTGKHVFVEKPLYLSREEAVEIRALLKTNSELRLSSNFNLRTAPRF
jgi:predicted dehydrogenase